MLLEGIKIVSFCHYLQGPGAMQYLADMGADVIKVEPLPGAHERNWSGARVYVGGVSGFYLCANRNKRAIALDLKSKAGKQIAEELTLNADVVVENFRPGVMDRLGLGYKAIVEKRPDIIYASASGFGSSGPMADRVGQDLLIQARSGLIAVTGNPSRLSTAVGCAAVDQHGAALLAMGILGAVVRKLTTKRGTRVESNLLSAGLDLQAEALTNYFSGKFHEKTAKSDVLQRGDNLATWYHEAPYGVYAAKDGALVLSLNDPEVLADALSSIDLHDLVSTDLYSEKEQYAKTVAKAIKEFTLAEIQQRFDDKGIWWERVQSYDDLFVDPQIQHNKTFRKIEINGEEATLVAHPLQYDEQSPEIKHIAQEIGQDAEDILMELGYSREVIEQLIQSGAIRDPNDIGGSNNV